MQAKNSLEKCTLAVKKVGGFIRRHTATCYDVLSGVCVVLVVVSFLLTFVLRQVTVAGDSMKDTLFDGDRLLVSSVFYDEPQRGDIVIIRRYVEEPIVKRVIGVAGDTVYIDPQTKELFVNDELQVEDYVHYPNAIVDMTEPVTVPDGCIFVMGDHRDLSFDSRDEDLGCVDVRDVVGKAIFRLYPQTGFVD